jgi:hypothetical protein
METTFPLTRSLPAADAEDAPTTGHKSARSPRVELITRGERRRVWTPEQKREIVMESLGPDRKRCGVGTLRRMSPLWWALAHGHDIDIPSGSHRFP